MPARFAAAAALLLLAPAAQAAGAESLLYERILMSRADARCGLFQPAVARALKASALQARGAALRAGAAVETTRAVERRAVAKAAATPCASPELASAAGRVRDAFEGWSRLSRLELEGGWIAERMASAGRWRLRQATTFGVDRAVLGLEGPAGRPAVAVTFADGRVPSAARLRLRDPARDPRPNLNGTRLPSPGSTRVLWAGATESAPETLAPAGAQAARLHRWPAGTAAALAALDPREAVAADFVFSDRHGSETIRTAVFQVGDVAAALAFLAASP